MSIDQCPSTIKGEKQRPGRAALAQTPRRLHTVAGRPVWRSADEYSDTPEFREFLEREFPAGASELDRAEWSDAKDSRSGESRRTFLKVMGASMALAGAATVPGCRRPDHKILPFTQHPPEEAVPGKPMFFATSMAGPDGGAEGLLVETHSGRPTKIEGNPLHPTNRGRCSSWALASILSLYDPDRLKHPVYLNPEKGRLEATWDDFVAWQGPHFEKLASTKGAGLGLIVGKASSPAREAMVAEFSKRFPEATVVWYSSADNGAALVGTEMAFGGPHHEILDISRENTKIIVSLDREFLAKDPGELPNARGFAASRIVNTTADGMSRLYVVESGFSLTGGQADHRLRLAPSRITAFAAELVKQFAAGLGELDNPLVRTAAGLDTGTWSDAERRFVETLKADLLAFRGKSLVVAGPTQPPVVHALAVAINRLLGNIGASVRYVPMTASEGADSVAGLSELVEKMNSGTIDTLVVLDANPAFDAPADLDFGAAWEKVSNTITLSVGQTETAAASTWMLNGTHYLESWGDTRAIDGTIAPVQPMIKPLYDPARSEIEVLAMLAGAKSASNATVSPDGYEIVQTAWKKVVKADFQKAWRRALHDGFVAGLPPAKASQPMDSDPTIRALASMTPSDAPVDGSLDVAFRLGNLHDGRFANAAWLQELPEVGTRTVWDNPMLLSPATASRLGLSPAAYSDEDPSAVYTKPKYPLAQMAEIEVGGRTMTGPVWILPGMAENTVLLTLGYGRTMCGKVGDGVGQNANVLRTSLMREWSVTGATLKKVPGTYEISSTQNHWTMEGRTAIVRSVDLEVWKKFGDEVAPGGGTFYDEATMLTLGERLGDLSHTPPNQSIYKNPYNASSTEAKPGSKFAERQQWGMTIDQTTCTGCGACTIACQAENNIPVVGKKEVAKGREMTWIRVDRYFTGDDINEPADMHHQPVACVHCENAPCETVCPVNATVHGPEGLNYMVYNRCIGTRYCANNCPYKVRRYNFFEYGKHAFNGDYVGKETMEKVMPNRGGVNGSNVHNKFNINFIPPRLREKLAEIERMQKNPNVSVRMRGVMEKCSYCVQRINAARIECKLADLKGTDGKHVVPDGFFEVACQQACPSGAITFGNILDETSKIYATRNSPRSYLLLGYLNTRPRTSHMVRVMNPHPELVTAERKESWKHPFHHGGHEAGHGADGHGHGNGTEGGTEGHGPAEPAAPASPGHSYRFEKSKLIEDRGYALSLNVLTGGGVS